MTLLSGVQSRHRTARTQLEHSTCGVLLRLSSAGYDISLTMTALAVGLRFLDLRWQNESL
jgi:hypothetical protein